MSKLYAISEETLIAICDALREKGKTEDPLKISDLPEFIENLSGGGLIVKEFTETFTPISLSGAITIAGFSETVETTFE